jgi:drug/metabolite transporter (DMT)-like permease
VEPRDQRLGLAALLLAAALFGAFGPLIREMSKMFGDAAQVTARLSIGFLVATSLISVTGRMRRFPKANHGRLFSLGAAQAGIYTFFTLSVTQTKIANTTFLLFAGIILVSTVLGVVIFRERITIWLATSIALALCGLVIYNGPSIDTDSATAFGILAGCCAGLTTTFRKLLKNEDALVIVWVSLGYATLVSLALLAISNDEMIRTVSWPSALATMAFGVLVVTQSQLVTYAFSHVNLSAGSVILSTELVFGALFGWIGYNEVPTSAELAGALFIVCGAILLAVRHVTRSRPTTPVT